MLLFFLEGTLVRHQNFYKHSYWEVEECIIIYNYILNTFSVNFTQICKPYGNIKYEINLQTFIQESFNSLNTIFNKNESFLFFFTGVSLVDDLIKVSKKEFV